MEKSDKIYVAGHRGLVGSAIVRSLKKQGYENVIGRSHKELDLTEQAAVRAAMPAFLKITPQIPPPAHKYLFAALTTASTV